MSGKVQKLAASAQRQMNAVVVSSGLMHKTVKVRVGVQKWNNHIRKDFNGTQHLMVHDPASSLRTGDIISISSGWRVSKNVHHVVRSILAPFGEPIEARPAVPTEEQRMAERIAKQDAKIARKQARERGYILPKDSYTPEELQTIKERRQAKRDKWIQGYEAAKGEPMPDKLKFRFMNYQEKVEYCEANDLPIPEHKPVVKKEKVAAMPPTSEELAAIRQQRQAKREERSKLYKERTGTEIPDWQLYSWMNVAERKEWHARDPETARTAELKWRENREIKYNQSKNL